MKRNVYLCHITVCLCIALSGCLAVKSPDEYGYALVLGVDRGETAPYYVSMLLQRSNGDVRTVAGREEGSPIVGVECRDIFEAIDLMESALPVALHISRVTGVIFSADIAKSGGIAPFLSAPLGELQMRYYANLAVAHGRAADFLCGLQNELNPNVAKLQVSFVEYGASTGYVPSVTLSQFYDRAWRASGDVLLPLGTYDPQENTAAENTNSKTSNPMDMDAENTEKAEMRQNGTPLTDLLGSTDFLPSSMYTAGGLQSSLMGSAVFSGTELVGYLNGRHTQFVLMGNGQFQNGRIHVLLDGQAHSIRLEMREKPRVSITPGDQLQTTVTLHVYADIEQSAVYTAQASAALAAEIAAHLEQGMQETYLACRDVGADVFELGKAVVTQFDSTQSWEAFDWKSAYQSTEATFCAEVTLVRNPAVSRME